MKLIPKTPKIIKLLFPTYVWNIKTSDKNLYLTFDDGPTPEITDWVLNKLSEYNAKATFFCLGKNVQNYPEIYNRILTGGHAVGNHTFTHMEGWRTTPEEYINDVKETSIYIKSKLFRPPYGRITITKSKALQKLGYKIIMWDVVAIDWSTNTSKKKTAENVIKNSKPGSIIVFHDSVKAEKNMKYALSQTLDFFSNEGYMFKEIVL